MKKVKYIVKICICSMFLITTITPRVFAFGMDDNAAMENNLTMGNNAADSIDFNMDMIMDQGNYSMDQTLGAMNNANDTNFMNHNMDNSMDFFFDNLDSYQADYENPLSDMDDNMVNNAFQDGQWSSSFNDSFNSDTGMNHPDVEFVNNEVFGKDDSMPIDTNTSSNLSDEDTLEHIDANTMGLDDNLDNAASSLQDLTQLDMMTTDDLLNPQDDQEDKLDDEPKDKDENGDDDKDSLDLDSSDDSKDDDKDSNSNSKSNNDDDFDASGSSSHNKATEEEDD